MRCFKCGSEEKVEEHHIHPRFMDNPFGEGHKIPLCNKCHQIFHTNIIPVFLFNEIQNQQQTISNLKVLTYKWLGGKDEQLRCSDCDAALDIEDKVCPYCNKLNEVDDEYS